MTITVIFVPLHPVSLTHKNPQRRKVILWHVSCRTQRLTDRSLFFFFVGISCLCDFCGCSCGNLVFNENVYRNSLSCVLLCASKLSVLDDIVSDSAIDLRRIRSFPSWYESCSWAVTLEYKICGCYTGNCKLKTDKICLMYFTQIKNK